MFPITFNSRDFGIIAIDASDPYDRHKETVMNFGQALEGLKNGTRATRTGWNGNGMWVCLIHPGNAMHLGFDMQKCFGLKTVNGTMQPGWVPSTSDLLAEDWEILK